VGKEAGRFVKATIDIKSRLRNMVLRRSSVLMFALGVLMFIPLAAQLYKIQILQHDEFQRRAISNQTRGTMISAGRGTIYDRNGRVLAISVSAETISIEPRRIRDDEQAQFIARSLADILNMDYEWILSRARRMYSGSETIAWQVDKETADKVRAFKAENRDINTFAIHIAPDTRRVYPLGTLAAHIIGFTSRTEGHGQQGIETQHNRALTGLPGRTVALRDASGREMPFTHEQHYPAQNGFNLHLTIDETIQYILSKNLEIAIDRYDVRRRALAIAMCPKTGAILGMAIEGGGAFDLNDPRTITDPRMIQIRDDGLASTADLQNQMWRNNAVSDTYEPGSTFKIITAAIALDEGVVRPTDVFHCGGGMQVGDRFIHCWRRQGHGSQNFHQGMFNSCNPVFMQTAQRIGTQTFSNYLESFGLLERTGIDLPGEGRGQAILFPRMTELDLSIQGFGQTLTVTPLQLIRAVAAVANGGYLMTPHVVSHQTDDDGNMVWRHDTTPVRQVISGETSRQMREILEETCISGTGRNAYVRGYRVAGKTGTSEVVPRGTERRIVSFVGFAPANDPQVVVLVYLDEPMLGPPNMRSGGIMAAPIVGRIMSEILPYMGVQPDFKPQDLPFVDIATPTLRGVPLADAQRTLNAQGIRFRVEGTGDTVTDQIPAPLAMIPGTTEIILYAGVERPSHEIVVPNVLGMTRANANRRLEDAGFIMRPVGATGTQSNSIVATRMSIEAGSFRSIGTVIEVEFGDTTILN
jgi:stage V sporulation protein D (sporulation-specific penicillin-binding protein)